MKRFWLVVFAAVVMMVTGIGGDALAQEKVIKLTYSDHNPPTAWCTVNATEPWAKQIEKATNGRVKVERYYAEAMIKGTDAWMALKSGVVDMAWCSHGYWPGMTPLSDVITLPFLPFKSGRQAGGVLWKLYEKYPKLQNEYADVKVLLVHATPPFTLFTTKKQVKTMEDLKGLKLRVLGGPSNRCHEGAGRRSSVAWHARGLPVHAKRHH